MSSKRHCSRDSLLHFKCTFCQDARGGLHPVPCCSFCAYTVCADCFVHIVKNQSKQVVFERNFGIAFESVVECPDCKRCSTQDGLSAFENRALYDMYPHKFESKCPRCHEALTDSAFSSHVLKCLTFSCSCCNAKDCDSDHVYQCRNMKCPRCPWESLGNGFSLRELIQHLDAHRNFETNRRALGDHAKQLEKLLKAAEDPSKLEAIDFTLIHILSQNVKTMCRN